MMKTNLTILSLAGILLISCTDKGSQNTANEPTVQAEPTTPAADVRQNSGGQSMLVSKGVVRSENEIKVYSRLIGQLNEVKILEGRKVRKGEELFSLDDWELKNKVLLSESELERAKLRMEEILVSQGYKREQFSTVPAKIVEYARIKSGMNVCERELEISREKLSMASIKASVSGVVTGVNAVSFAFVEPGETLCTIVDPSHLIVEFSILETELRKFSIGTTVEVRSIAYNEAIHHATVRSIGSVVGKDGMIKVEASLQDCKNLLPGMTAIVNL